MTIQAALNVSHRTISFRDAEVFLADVLRVDRAYLYAHPEQVLTDAEVKKYDNFLERREHNEPVAYITGYKEFYGREFFCDTRALIPRPETEGVVEYAVSYARDYFAKHLKQSNLPCPFRIHELGTGCGNIAISIALELAADTPSTIIATDIAPEALELAKENWGKLSVEVPLGNIHLSFIAADLFDHPLLLGQPFNLIVANLPYVEDTWRSNPVAQPDVVFYEPEVALFGGHDGLDIYRRFFEQVLSHLTDDGAIIIEYGDTQTHLILPIIAAAIPDKKVKVHKDYAGLDRVIEIR